MSRRRLNTTSCDDPAHWRGPHLTPGRGWIYERFAACPSFPIFCLFVIWYSLALCHSHCLQLLHLMLFIAISPLANVTTNWLLLAVKKALNKWSSIIPLSLDDSIAVAALC